MSIPQLWTTFWRIQIGRMDVSSCWSSLLRSVNGKTRHKSQIPCLAAKCGLMLLPAFTEFKERLLIVNAEPAEDRILSASTVYSNPGDYWQRFEVKSIDELDDIKEKMAGTIMRAQSARKRLNVFMNWIKLQVRVQDATGSSLFVLFERDVTGYVNKPASQLISNANNGDHFELFPTEFNTMVGRRFAWKIKVSTYNIVNKYYVYTVNKFTNEDSVIQAVLKRAATGEDSQNDVDVLPLKQLPSLTVGPSAKDAMSVTGENASPVEALKSTASSPGSKQKQVVQHDDEELVLTASSSKRRPDVQKMKIPKLEKF